MKRFAFLLFCAALTCSCVSRNTADRIAEEKDSLARVVEAKDSLVDSIFETVNTIAENLAAIRIRENLITSVSSNDESLKGPTGQIDEDLAAIDQLLQENRARIESLERSAAQLRRARVKVDGLEKMIAQLEAQLEAKNEEIAELKQSLTHLGIQVETLTAEVEQQQAEVDELAQANRDLEDQVRERTEQLHTVYYIVGRQKDLLAAGIVEKKGFIGRTLRVSDNPATDRFTQDDGRTLTVLPIGEKNVALATMHPEGSYRLRQNDDKVVEALEILDPERFWAYSKILVVTYK